MEALTAEAFHKNFLENRETGLVLFLKESCPICQELQPLLEEIEKGYKDEDFSFYYVDAIKEAPFYKSLKLQGTPTVLFYRGGQQCQKFTGLREYDEIEFMIDRVMAGHTFIF